MTNGWRGNASFFIAGAVAGAVGALLATPLTGRRLRRALSFVANDCSDQLIERTEDLRRTGQQLRRKGQKLVRQTARRFARA